MADFIIECSYSKQEEKQPVQELHAYSLANTTGAGYGIVLVSPKE